jgi:hypothetical protein
MALHTFSNTGIRPLDSRVFKNAIVTEDSGAGMAGPNNNGKHLLAPIDLNA